MDLVVHCIATLWLWVGIWPISSGTCLLSSIYAQSLMSAISCMLSGLTTGYLWPIRSTHMAYCPASLLVRTPSSLSDQSFLPGLHARWHTIRDTGPIREVGTTRELWLRLYHVALHLSGTWISHLCTQSYEELMEGCGTSSGLDVITGKWGATRMSLGGWVVVHNRKTYIRPLVSQRKGILPLFYIYAHVFWSIQSHLG